jgi:hypothetical protein
LNSFVVSLIFSGTLLASSEQFDPQTTVVTSGESELDSGDGAESRKSMAPRLIAVTALLGFPLVIIGLSAWGLSYPQCIKPLCDVPKTDTLACCLLPLAGFENLTQSSCAIYPDYKLNGCADFPECKIGNSGTYNYCYKNDSNTNISQRIFFPAGTSSNIYEIPGGFPSYMFALGGCILGPMSFLIAIL